MGNVNYDELFGNFTAGDALAATEKKNEGGFSRNPDLFKPSINDEKCKDMNYKALIRFMPFFHEGKRMTTLLRWECFLRDVNGENGMFVVSPKTKDPKAHCPMRSLSYKLWSSGSAADKENSKKISVYQQFYALVEVVKDVQHPEYNGKIFIYQFGKIVNDILTNAMKDSEFSEGINPFGFYDGNLFEINLKKDASKKMDNGKAVTDYSACRFTNNTAPIHFGDGLTLTNDRDSQKAYMEWLEKDAPKIKDYLWKEWDSETTEKVNTLLATYTSEYKAPRTTVAQAKETIDSVTNDPTPTPGTSKSNVSDVPDDPFAAGAEIPDDPFADSGTSVSEDNDEWMKDIVGE